MKWTKKFVSLYFQLECNNSPLAIIGKSGHKEGDEYNFFDRLKKRLTQAI